MSYRPAQQQPKAIARRYAHLNDKAHCSCECYPQAPAVKTKKQGLKRVDGTRHQARHTPACPHSELVVTAFRLTTAAKKRAGRIARECWLRRVGKRH